MLEWFDIRRSLGAQIALAFLVVSLAPFAGFFLFSYAQVKEGTTHAVQQNLSLLVSQVGTEVERTVATAARHVKALAANPVLTSAQAGIEEKLTEMSKIQSLYGVFDDITLVDLDGVVLASTTYQYRGEWKKKDWFLRAKAGEVTVSPAHVIAKPFKLVLVVTAPVIASDGAIRAVLGGQVDMQVIWNITDQVRLGSTGHVVIVDKAANVLAHPNKELLLEKLQPDALRQVLISQEGGVFEFQQAEQPLLCQFTRLAGYQEYRGQEWRLGIIQARSEVYAVVDRLRGQILLVLLSGSILIFFLSGLFSRSILEPIQELNTGLKKMAKGDLKTKVAFHSLDEMGRLAAAFNAMARQIESKTAELDAANQQLNMLNSKLSESNTNLQQFAYVASHDLQEPLRMVSSYVQLLERRYQGKLDADADEFIGFAVDGARRMQQLINDLLEYSRVSTRQKPFEPTDVNVVMARVLETLKLNIEERHASVTHDTLPTVTADAQQLEQLLQNLVGNAVKFCKDRCASVRVSAAEEGKEWVFSVRDNGIGIETQYYERVFTIFQRLHTREEYPGTGIGLAICKKIVMRHGGRIWVESQPGNGSAFFFTIPQHGSSQ